MKTIKLAEALLRRKELQERLKVMDKFRQADVYEERVKRINVTESIDEVRANIPKLTLSQVMAEYNYTARALREIDAKIQQVNWTADVEVAEHVLTDYEAKAS